MIFGPKDDGTYVIEFRTAAGDVLAISIPRTETAPCAIRFCAGNNAAHQPARLAHLDHHHQSRGRIKRGETSAEIIDLDHGATSIGSYGR
jgi:hypothetical protein